MYYIIPIILIVVSIIIILAIIIRRLPNMTIIDVETIPQEQEEKIKKKILTERLHRGGKRYWDKIEPVLSGVWNAFRSRFYGFLERAKTMEIKHRGKKKKKDSDIFVILPELLGHARDAMKKRSYREAERLLVEALSHDGKNVEAYRLLGELYFDEKNFPQAKSTYEFILKLSPDNEEAIAALAKIAKLAGDLSEARDLYLKAITLNDKEPYYFLELGMIFKSMENEDLAFNNFLKANALEPNNPRTLDFLLDSSIILKKRGIAENLLAKLREVNPENQKLEELENKIKALPVV